MRTPLKAQALSLLRQALNNPTAQFRDGQWEATASIILARSRLLVVQRTLPHLPGSGIIYALTIKDTERVADWLNQQGIHAQAYHAKLTHEQRLILENQLLNNKIKALVATTALGMGFDKPDLGFVIHYQRPGSVVHYYQQAHNLDGVFDVNYWQGMKGAVFLINDRVDSRWTFTVIAALLRQAGSGSVFPLALALNSLT